MERSVTELGIEQIPVGDICVYPTPYGEWTFAVVGEAPGCFDVTTYERTIIQARTFATARGVDLWILDVPEGWMYADRLRFRLETVGV